MQRFLEILFGVKRDAATDGAERLVAFNPPPWMGEYAAIINTLLALAALAIVVLIYRREVRDVWARVLLACFRIALFAYVITLLNRPVLKITKQHVEPSVLAILIDRSVSMSIRDQDPDGALGIPSPSLMTTRPAGTQPVMLAGGGKGPTRLEAAIHLLSGEDQQLIRNLAKVHTLRFYSFSRDADALDFSPGAAAAPAGATTQPAAAPAVNPQTIEAIAQLQPDGRTTQVVPSLLTVLEGLQGQRLAGIVVITDARETPTSTSPALFEKLKKYNARIFPVPVGTENAPKNLEVAALDMQDSVFKDDIVSVKVRVRGSGYDPGKAIRVTLKDKKTGAPLKTPEGKVADKSVVLADDQPQEIEINVLPDAVGTLDVTAQVDVEEGELDSNDNARTQQVAVLDAKINVLYVDGYPRWEYRYIKNEMIRDKSVNISCLLTSADATFAQEGDPADSKSDFLGPIKDFPTKMEDLMKYDVVVFGDVDPRRFTDAQLQLVADFVSKKGGGFGMIAGPQHSPIKYRNTAIEAVLPVNINLVQPEDPGAVYDEKEAFIPVVTDVGRKEEGATIFRFHRDKAENDKILSTLPPMFWFCDGVVEKPGVGLVYAEHPARTAPTGRKAPLLVLGRFGAGRTLFSAVDDSWRWRYYTGESIFDTYWVQQLRYLARSKKLGQRKVAFTTDRPTAIYEPGERIEVKLKIYDPILLTQLPPQLEVKVIGEDGQPVRLQGLEKGLQKQEQPADLYTLTFTADRIGKFTIKMPPIVDKAETMDLPVEVILPRLELTKPQVDRLMLTKLAPPEQIVQYAEARAKLPEIIKSAAKINLEVTDEHLWNRWAGVRDFRATYYGGVGVT